MQTALRLLTWSVVAAGLAITPPPSKSGAPQAALPTLRHGVLYLQAQTGLEVSLVVRVTVEDGRVVDHVIESPQLHLHGHEVGSTLRTWQFEPGWSGTFALRMGFRGQKTEPCVTTNPTVAMTVPTEILIAVPPDWKCDPTIAIETVDRPVRTILGLVRCDCPGAHPVPGATLHVSAAPGAANDVHREVRAGPDGHFRVDGLPSGRYEVSASGDGFRPDGARVTVDADASDSAPLDLALAEHRWPRPPDTVVVSAGIPDYPAAARAADVEGDVTIRLSMRSARVTPLVEAPTDEIMDVNVEAASSLLAEAAERNVRTWRLTRTAAPLIPVTFRYRLVPGDCGPNQQASVEMRFPHEVEVRAKRPIRCR